MRIDENGERDADYGILDLDPITGEFEVIAHYYGQTKLYNPITGKRIHWPAGRDGPPQDVPRCGFLGNDPVCVRNGKISLSLFFDYVLLRIIILSTDMVFTFNIFDPFLIPNSYFRYSPTNFKQFYQKGHIMQNE